MTRYTSRYKEIFEALERGRNILIISHQSPDGDTIGANLALRRFLESRSKHCVSFCVDKPHSSYSFLPGVDQITNDSRIIKEGNFDTIIMVDADLRYSSVRNVVENLDYDFTLINIDHHFTNDHSGDVNLVISHAASTTLILYYLFLYAEMKIDRIMALYLLTGIVYDTDGFNNPATDTFALKTSSELLLLGARIPIIVRSILRNKSVNTLRLWGRALSRLKYDSDRGIATTLLTKEDMDYLNLSEDATAGISNFLNGFGQADIILILRDLQNGYVKGSYRTTGDGIDVSEYAKVYGGGGHKKAAGFMVEGCVRESERSWEIVSV